MGCGEEEELRLVMPLYQNIRHDTRSPTGRCMIEDINRPGRTTIFLSVEEKPGALAEILELFQEREVGLTHIESRPSKTHKDSCEFLVECEENANKESVEHIIAQLRQNAERIIVDDFNHISIQNEDRVPWFPSKIADIDKFANRVLSYGSELDADHPGFKDEAYRTRRNQFADIAFNYKHGEKIPVVEYTDDEINTWRVVYNELTRLYPTHACAEFNYIFPLLQQHCGYEPNRIPQLHEVSSFLKSCTGFTLRPVAGLLSSRDFLAGLAFRVFHSTQYIRHSSSPHYTPEPDVCHELLGHAPLFADVDFAQFSQQIGLASLGVSDDVIEKLATLYWFTVEFGVCMENGERKAFGAGLLSSFGELQYALSDKVPVQPEIAQFDPAITSITSYPITEYQPKYFLANSFADAKAKLTSWTSLIPRPFQVRYNSYTQRIEILDTISSVQRLVRDIKGEVETLEDALAKLKT